MAKKKASRRKISNKTVSKSYDARTAATIKTIRSLEKEQKSKPNDPRVKAKLAAAKKRFDRNTSGHASYARRQATKSKKK